MKKLLSLCLGLTLVCSFQAKAQPKLNATNIDEVVAAMTLDEKARMVNGIGTFWGGSASCRSLRDVPGLPGGTYAIPRLGIPGMYFGDGPLGIRLDEKRAFDSHHYYATAEPVPLLLGSSWDPEVIRRVAQDIAEECRDYGVDIMLGPSMNILRNPLCGRTHEYYSEDPLLAGCMAGAFIEGVQSVGIGASLKHFAVNNQETNRSAVNAIVSQRALREIYLKGFEKAIKICEPWTVMSSYNGLNGEWTSESRALLGDVLRGDWGFKGMVMTDWGGGVHPVKQMQAGNDLLEPGTEAAVKEIEQAVKDGRLDEKVLDTNVKRILQTLIKTYSFRGYKFSNNPDLKAHRETARRAAAEGAVLLKNDGGTLPFSKSIKKVAIYGRTGYQLVPGGIGWNESSSGNNGHVSLVEGLRKAHYNVDYALLQHYARLDKPANPWEQKDVKKPVGEVLPGSDELQREVADNDVALIVLGHAAGEGSDRTANAFYLSESEKQMLTQVAGIYHAAGKKVVVLLNIPGPIEMESWQNIPDAILCLYQGGEQFGNWTADILKGDVTPSGKLTMTFAKDLKDYPSSSNFPLLDKKFDMMGMMAQGGHFEKKDKMVYEGEKNIDYTKYEEGIYVGYRYFDTKNIDVTYPFGYGLSYTTFSYGKPSVTDNGKNITVTVTITNTGNHKGKEIAQVYVVAPKGAVEKPAHELKSFGKTRLLQPGETETLTMTIDKQDLASFNTKASSWIADSGVYKFQVAASSRDIKSTVSLRLKGFKKKVRNVLKP